ncbi:hypothetical protein RZS08_43805, partial [Arthrospira platensis SPKY1]|nr:hypothetical protein [Arthrospira platensis SPKY1]
MADALFAESPHRVVYEWKHRARLLKKACSLTISSAEYEMFAHDEGLADCAESLGTLKAYLTDASSVASIENTIQAIRAQSGVFYDIAHRRNEIML